jgi:hypothetical protein
MDIEALAIGLRKAADDYDDTIRMIVSLAGEHGVDTNAVVGYTIDPQRAVSEHSPLMREAAEALTTMQAREATLIRVLLKSRTVIENEMHVLLDSFTNLSGPDKGKVTDEVGLAEIRNLDEALVQINEALGTSGLVP